jgi:D-alanine-D-alanine ligase
MAVVMSDPMPSPGLRIAVLANLKKNAPTWPGMSPDQWDDLDSEKTVNAIVAALESHGHSATFLEGNLSLVETLPKLKPDICFNICEGHFGDARESHVPAILEMIRIPYTASKVMTLALALDKPMTKRVLSYHGLPTPEFQVFERVDEPLDPALTFPLFVKPSREGTGMGISAASIVRDDGELRDQLRTILGRYRQPALVERFIEGREVTLGLVGNLTAPVARRLPEDEHAPRVSRGLHFFPPLEVDMQQYPAEEGGIYSNRLKVDLADSFFYHCPAPLSAAQVERLEWLTAAVFRVTGCLDVARVDFRLDASADDAPYILEINPLPGLTPDYSDLCIEATAGGWSYEALINGIVDVAAQRSGILQPTN